MDAARVLRRARTQAGLSLRGLADRAGTSHSALAAYEAGRTIPSTETLARIVRAAGFAVDVELRRRVDPPDFDRGDELVAVLELAAAFPARHEPLLRYPVFGR